MQAQDGRLSRTLGPLLLAATGITLLLQGWKTWPDVVSDTGRELYLAWRLSEGDVLYRDVAHFNGPLSPYLDALWFRVAGVGFTQLVVADLLVVVALTALVVRGGRALGDRFTAWSSALVFLCVFAFGPLTPGGSFGYLAPYSHEMTHGLLLLLLLLPCLAWDARGAGSLPAAAGGLLLGLVFLTKPELFLAGAACALVGLPAGRLARGEGAGAAAAAVGALGATALVPPLVAFALLTAAMPAAGAWRGVLGAWVHLGNPDLVQMPYFRLFLGTYRTWQSVVALSFWSLVWTAAIGALWLLARLAGRRPRGAALTAGAVPLGVAVLLAWAHRSVPWLDAMRPLPLFLLALLAVDASWLIRRKEAVTVRSRRVLRLSLTVLSLALLLKMLLYARVWHYGFVLGMPGTLMVAAALLCWIPRRLGGHGLAAPIFRTGAAALLAAVVFAHAALAADQRREKTARVGRGTDALWADPERGPLMEAAATSLERRLPEGGTLAVLPDGVILNYLTRRRNPTRYIIGNPADMTMFGEGPVLDAYLASPPDAIALLACDTAIYGYRYFGRDYAEPLAAWIDRSYVPVELLGAPPFTGQGFGIVILRRRDAAPPSGDEGAKERDEGGVGRERQLPGR